ncbi:MAG: SurA N-terminal domain-containing protein [Candidatus Omnitrophota bacterium]|nr:SurA N-terminal domain-containing protein [Candidatus Omnitrophota bacterium]
MKKYVLSLVFLLSLSGLSYTQDAMSTDRIIAVVNNEPITQSDVEELLAVYYMQGASVGRTEKEIVEEIKKMQPLALNRLIEDKLILTEAKKQKIEVDEKVVEERIAEIKRSFPQNHDFEQAIIEQGLTPSGLRNKIKEQQMMSLLVETAVKRNIRVSPTEVAAYYQVNQDQFNIPESAEVDSIFCDSLKKADEALSRLKEGKDFEAIRQEFSLSSPLGLIKKGELIKDIDGAIFSLSEGAISDVVKANNGFYIFKLVKKNSAAKLSLVEAEDKIKDRLFKEKMDEGFKKWIEGLKKSAYIVIK